MKLVWTGRARTDLDRVWLFLAERDIALADGVTREIQLRCDRLVEFPRIAPTVTRDIRQWSMPNIGYVVTYTIDGDQIRIRRVHHAQEDRERA
ncbi:hypothetical protein HMP06_3167 [Sphingomonas sp. HMP6]|nr:type II toxin-antitoxin system RelE/ParE family toxin [Sphingomonas sp. HMP6]BCA60398.1 hypothetical protein HMP06_3167 [Sphingomonas sp. HMP6]